MRALARPKWIAGHLLAVVVVVTFANLGLWQLRRHDWRAELNASIATGLARPPEPFGQLPAGERAYRRVTVEGRYAPSRDVLLTPRNERGPGHHLLTPLELDDGRLLVVDRGWVPFRFATPPVPGTEPPSGDVRVSGVLLPATRVDPRAAFDSAGRPIRVAAVDPSVVAGEQAVEDVFLLLQRQSPPPGQLPVPGPLPQTETGPHLSYAVQWFLFAGVVVVGYPLLLRRATREPEDEPDVVRA